MVSVVLAEGRRAGEFMVSEARGMQSRDVGNFTNSGGTDIVLPAGLVLGQLAADSSWAPYTNAGTLGLQVATGILWDNTRIPAGATVKATYIARNCEVNAAELQYAAGVLTADKTAALVDLRAIGIIPR